METVWNRTKIMGKMVNKREGGGRENVQARVLVVRLLKVVVVFFCGVCRSRKNLFFPPSTYLSGLFFIGYRVAFFLGANVDAGNRESFV